MKHYYSGGTLTTTFTIIFLLLGLGGCKTKQEKIFKTPPRLQMAKPSQHAKNVILMIGDGMGLGQISAGVLYSENPLNFERFKKIGFHKSAAGNDLITDSAAGATAFACGVKTYNGAIGVNMDTIVQKSILEEAEQKGLKTGLVATSTIVHATPASFIAHNKSRKNYEEIALDFLKIDIDFFAGGGRKYFNRRTIDDRDLYEELREKGYYIADFIDGNIKDLKLPKDKKVGYLTADDSPLPVSQGRDYLQDVAMEAIHHLENQENGFFLMIEGSQIDWGGHSNNAAYIISEVHDFDKVIGKVLDWAELDGETLVIVTADHETGGFAINKGSTRDSIKAAFTSDYHTGTMIPVFSYGPGSDDFLGIFENTAIYNKIRNAYNW
jgi:alkaline phosphatase